MADDPTGILTQIRDLLAGQKSSATDDDFDDGGGGRVPVARLRRVIDERNALRQQLAEMGSRVEELQKGYAAQLEDIKAQTAEQVKGLSSRHAEDLQLVDLGLRDPLGRQALRAAWEHQPKDGRGKSPADWWQQQVEAQKAHAADPEAATAPSVPATLTGYLPTVEAPAPAPAPQSSRGAPPTAGGKREPASLSNVPVDQGFDKFLAGLREAG